LDDLVDNCDAEIPRSDIIHVERENTHRLYIQIFWGNKGDGLKYGNFIINEIEKMPDFEESSYIPHNDSNHYGADSSSTYINLN